MLVSLSTVGRWIGSLARLPLRRFRLVRTIDASREMAWRVMSEPRLWSRWGPSVRDVTPEGLQLRSGARGQILTVIGIWVPFEITSVTDGRSWEWRVLGVPATGHLVQPVGPRRSRVSFELPLLAFPYAVVCAVALRRIERLAVLRGPGEADCCAELQSRERN